MNNQAFRHIGATGLDGAGNGGKVGGSSTVWSNSPEKQKPAEGGPCIPV